MEEDNKLPLKRVEFSLTKFNEVAIPHHLDLLRQHKANILKFEQSGEYARVRAEQTNARRVTSQLRTLLTELESLRQRVRSDDLAAFDRATRRARDTTLHAIVDYLETSPLAINRTPACDSDSNFANSDSNFANSESNCGLSCSAVSTESVGLVKEPPEAQTQLLIREEERILHSREAVLHGWNEIQTEVHALHAVWRTLHEQATSQRETVDISAQRIEEAAVNVQAGRMNLAAAERLKSGALSVGGAVAGALVGGPVGAAVGLKAGAAAALAGSLLGYLGGKVLGRRRQEQITLEQLQPEDSELTEKTDKKSD